MFAVKSFVFPHRMDVVEPNIGLLSDFKNVPISDGDSRKAKSMYIGRELTKKRFK